MTQKPLKMGKLNNSNNYRPITNQQDLDEHPKSVRCLAE